MYRTLMLRRNRLSHIVLLTLIGLFLLLPNITVLASEIGGYISEKLIERTGVASSSLVIGTGNPQIDVGMGPSIATLPAQTTPGKGSATLRGNVSDLNNFPLATVWFEWGYDTSYGNTAGTQTVTSTGTYTATITNPTGAVHYRFVASADGTNYGDDSSFDAAPPATTMLMWMIPTVFAIFGTVVLFALRGSPVAVIVAGILITIGILIITNVVGSLW